MHIFLSFNTASGETFYNAKMYDTFLDGTRAKGCQLHQERAPVRDRGGELCGADLKVDAHILTVAFTATWMERRHKLQFYRYHSGEKSDSAHSQASWFTQNYFAGRKKECLL